MLKKNRVHSLDYLRGMMAVAIMLYHYSTWSGLSLSKVFSVFSIYGVSIFYILSGLSLTLAYNQKLTSTRELRDYIIKRFFRILPLFAMAVTATIILKYAQYLILNNNFNVSVYEVLLNYSLLFGFIDTSLYLPVGGWSIGNEMVFYALFPLIMYFVTKKMNTALYVTYATSLLLYLYFAFVLLGESNNSLEKWYIYINPFNQIFLFYTGIMIALFFSKIEVNRPVGYFFIGIIIAVFLLYTGRSEREYLTEGLPRIIFTLLSIILVLFIYRTQMTLNRILDNSLLFLGEISYSIYLLHPLVGLPIAFLCQYIGLELVYGYGFSVLITLYVSHISYKYVEKPMMNYGKKMG